MPWPEPKLIEELDEHQVDRLIKVAMPASPRRSGDGRMHAAYVAAETPRDKHRSFQLMFEQVVMLWVGGSIECLGSKRGPSPATRVWRGLWDDRRRTTRPQSGGVHFGRGRAGRPASRSYCGDRVAFDLGWRVRNCSVSEFVFTARAVDARRFQRRHIWKTRRGGRIARRIPREHAERAMNESGSTRPSRCGKARN